MEDLVTGLSLLWTVVSIQRRFLGAARFFFGLLLVGKPNREGDSRPRNLLMSDVFGSTCNFATPSVSSSIKPGPHNLAPRRARSALDLRVTSCSTASSRSSEDEEGVLETDFTGGVANMSYNCHPGDLGSTSCTIFSGGVTNHPGQVASSS